jgi:type IV pilus assembly protein PilM
VADQNAVWGIEIGQAGLKAIRVERDRDSDELIATNFDYIAHPKILNQPDAIPDELIRDAMKTFTSRNKIENEMVAISLPGANALSRFIKLPPVESSRIAEIVKYEARQQIPFPLEEVIWDFQPVGTGTTEGTFTLEAEIGLFAMKRDQVMKNLRPFLEKKIEVELIQIAPLALFNFLYFDVLKLDPKADANPTNENILIMDMGTDSTTLIVTNGYKIWTRNIPMGGNHFTRALTKEMKLTFAKAEHLKINATRSPDPRAVFQAMKGVFTEYAAEVQKSINFFAGANRESKIVKVIGVGGAFNMSGLQKYLEQHLQSYPVERVDKFSRLVGDSVINAPLFKENISTFIVPYGLAIQQLKKTSIRTTLLPPEIANERLVRQKKPWAVVAAAGLLAGLSLSAVGYASTYSAVASPEFKSAVDESKKYADMTSGYTRDYEGKVSEYQGLRDASLSYVAGIKDDTWLEFYKALTECFPRDVADQRDETDLSKQNRLYVDLITTELKPNLAEWYETLLPPQKIYLLGGEKETPPEGKGYLVTIIGKHYHHIPEDPEMQGANYLENTILKNLRQWTIKDEMGNVLPVRQMGISYATLISSKKSDVVIAKRDRERRQPRMNVLNAPPQTGLPGGGYPGSEGSSPMTGAEGMMEGAPQSGGIYDPAAMSGNPSANPGGQATTQTHLFQTDFKLQFLWKNVPKAERQPNPPDAAAPAEGDAASAT